MKAYFLTSVKQSELNIKVQALGKPFATLINTQLLQGVGLEVHQPYSGEYAQTRLFVYDGFLMVEATPMIKDRLCETIDKAQEELKTFLLHK